MIVLGLTGSIGMGKSTAAKMLRRIGVPVHDSDRVVHLLLARGGAAVAPIAEAFPGVVTDGVVDRLRLGAVVFRDPAALRRLEAILHPLVRVSQRDFTARAARRGKGVVVLDVPLLFETGGRERVDRTIVVTAPPFVQRARVLARPGMTPEKLAGILTRQMPDRVKRQLADYVVPTGMGRRVTRQALCRIVRNVAGIRGCQWPPRGYHPPNCPRPRKH